MSGLFPIVQPEAASVTAAQLPLAKEVAIDYETGQPIFAAGQPVVVQGAEAVRVWCHQALRTVRGRHRAYSWDYGCEAQSLIGQPYTQQIQQSEAIRCVREALLINPYITGVRQISVDFAGTTLTVQCAVDTYYGEVSIHV